VDGTKTLVVDDTPAIRKGLSLRLRANEYEVLFAANAPSATAILAKEKPDLVILDLGLPCGDGFVVMERLQKDDYLAIIAVIVLTGRESENTRNQALQAGAVDLLSKTRRRAQVVVGHSQGFGCDSPLRGDAAVC
jgi:two-component system, OmpR family, KDP operon response regulator KdpE